MKRCPKCGERKDRIEFYRCSAKPDGLRVYCKECQKAAAKDYYIKNPGRVRANVKRWQAQNPEAVAVTVEAYRSSEKWRATRQAWRERPDNRIKARAYYTANAEAAKARARARQAKVRGAAVEKFTHREIFDRDGWVCQLCLEPVDPAPRFPDPASVSLDHIVPLARGGAHTRANVQTTHLGCNKRKGAKVA